MWHYRKDAAAKVWGPFDNDKMKEWHKAGQLPAGLLVSTNGEGGPFVELSSLGAAPFDAATWNPPVSPSKTKADSKYGSSPLSPCTAPPVAPPPRDPHHVQKPRLQRGGVACARAADAPVSPTRPPPTP